jgi:Ca2+-binding RTX toxin-like protein
VLLSDFPDTNSGGKTRKRNLYPLLAAAIVAMGGIAGASTASAAATCTIGPGVTQTDTTVTGSSGNDTIDCTSANPGKTINGNGGNDTITGTAFDDTLNGDAGNDVLSGGIGMDTLSGSAGNDTLSDPALDLAVDTLNGGTGTDTCGPLGVTPDVRNSCES